MWAIRSAADIELYLPFQGNNTDRGPNSYHPTEYNSPTYTAGKTGLALTLNGSTQWASYAAGATPNLSITTGGLSISFLYKQDTITGGCIICRGSGGASAGNPLLYNFFVLPGVITFTDTTGYNGSAPTINNLRIVNIPFTPAANTWYRIQWSFDLPNVYSSARCMVNNVFYDKDNGMTFTNANSETTNSDLTSIATTNENTTIGRRELPDIGFIGNYVDGQISHLLIESRYKTKQELYINSAARRHIL